MKIIIVGFAASRSGQTMIKNTMCQHSKIEVTELNQKYGFYKTYLESYLEKGFILQNNINYVYLPIEQIKWKEALTLIDKFIELEKNNDVKIYLLHILRDGRNRCASLLNREWIIDARIAAIDWVNIMDAVDKYKELDNFLEIRYEDFCTNQAQVIKQVCEFVGIKYEPEMKHEINIPKFTFENLTDKQQEQIMEIIESKLKEKEYA